MAPCSDWTNGEETSGTGAAKATKARIRECKWATYCHKYAVFFLNSFCASSRRGPFTFQRSAPRPTLLHVDARKAGKEDKSLTALNLDSQVVFGTDKPVWNEIFNLYAVVVVTCVAMSMTKTILSLFRCTIEIGTQRVFSLDFAFHFFIFFYLQ